MKFNYTTYQSPFTWRYGSDRMRQIFSEQNKYRLWRKIWVVLAEVQHVAGLVSKVELSDLKKHEKNIDIARILEIEKETRHDVVAAIREYAEKAKVGGGKIHLGATSMDVVDNADSIRVLDALMLIKVQVVKILKIFNKKISQYASLPTLGYTHLQAAEPTTVGYRFALYAQDLLVDLEQLQFLQNYYRAKGLKGAVGSSASYVNLLRGTKLSDSKLEEVVMRKLDLTPATIANQVAPRKFDYLVLSLLASISSSCAKFAGDVRILQSANFGEWSEPFGTSQVGSSAMPFKKNPIASEKICSLARFVEKLPSVALGNASVSYLERTLDDSANKRIVMAEGFLATDEILKVIQKIVSGMVINKERIAYTLQQFGPFAATETILMEAVKKGANRQKMHETLRELSLKAWNTMQKGKKNPLPDLLTTDQRVTKYLGTSEIRMLLQVERYTGSAEKRARQLTRQIEKTIKTI